MSVKIKVHDVIHDRHDGYDAEEALNYIESWVTVDVENIRIASGPRNSPLFVTVDMNSISLKNVKKVARQVVKGFSRYVDGVDVDKTIRDDNILVVDS
jgi:hypothetical protein